MPPSAALEEDAVPAPAAAPFVRRLPALTAGFVVAAVRSAVGCTSWGNWIAESGLMILGAGALAATVRRFRFTPLVYELVLALAALVFAGAHYTYANVPVGAWMQRAFSLQRNDFDRVAHLVQGAAPALMLRELFVRRTSIKRGVVLAALVSMLCLGFAASWELLEWHFAAAVQSAGRSEDLGAQGDPWDAQQDMQMALIGAVAGQVVFSRRHDRQIAAMRA